MHSFAASFSGVNWNCMLCCLPLINIRDFPSCAAEAVGKTVFVWVGLCWHACSATVRVWRLLMAACYWFPAPFLFSYWMLWVGALPHLLSALLGYLTLLLKILKEGLTHPLWTLKEHQGRLSMWAGDAQSLLCSSRSKESVKRKYHRLCQIILILVRFSLDKENAVSAHVVVEIKLLS